MLVKVVAAQFPVSRLLLEPVLGKHQDRRGNGNGSSLGSFANLQAIEWRSQVSLTRSPCRLCCCHPPCPQPWATFACCTRFAFSSCE
ncbi:hypothetical protein AVDCRST_MAG94-6629 [uncultured Leptolyngbya sp.]|uniref:Uncharacterized protein n=1 Tax=uncultured Leptolyngbya sp. TaxID=332963 RepID=A0A6J4PJM1_9CYAN|nr:hypothetical protein AVDCRST_MAG94-6629 [uncultured Leptolyngbya sp.]